MEKIFSESGVLQQELPQYRVRENQIALADNIAQAIADNQNFVAEAGTGIGKTWAYSVPAMLSGKKIIFTTFTKVLQDQLFEKDLPFLRKVLKAPISIAILKGRDSYLCIERLFKNSNLFSQKYADALQEKIYDPNFSGDEAECAVPNFVFKEIKVKKEQCLRDKCPHFTDCFFYKARKKAENADAVVANHHVFFSYLVKTGIFKNAGVVVFDEAHHVPDIAKTFFSAVLESDNILTLLGLLESLKHLPKRTERKTITDSLSRLLGDWGEILPKAAVGKIEWKKCEALPKFNDYLKEAERLLRTLCEKLGNLTDDDIKSLQPQEIALFENVFNGLSQAWEDVQLIITSNENFVRFVEVYKTGAYKLTSQPISAGRLFKKHILEGHDIPKSLIFTSATLATGGNFDFFTEQLSLEGSLNAIFESPFSYQENALLYVPTLSVSHKNGAEYDRAVLRAAWRLIKASPGGVFVLCTTNKSCDEMHQILANVADSHLPDFLLLKQGQAAPHKLLAEFKAHGRSILVATRTFWEGVDVQGAALSLVIIDKIPFAYPDTVQNAICEWFAKNGKNPFMEFSVPQATMALKQGAGRLIRSETDKGVLMIADARMLTMNYGEFIKKSLPPMPITQNQFDAVEFLNQIPR